MFSSIPQPDEVYRFRSIDALIGSRKELYRQTIYLAKPDQLNDPAEDTVNVVWHGDEILWPNLIAYYEVGWEKWTPKSDKLERRRCQDEEGPARKV